MSSLRVFGLPHLSEDAVAAYADGVLSAAAAMRAEKHCRECHECASAVRVQREAVLMLRTASMPTLPLGLLDRLSNVPMSASIPPPLSGLPTAIGADGVAVFVTQHRARHGRNEDGRAVRRAALPLGVLATAVVVVAAGAVGSSMGLVRPDGPQQNAPAVIAPAVFNQDAAQVAPQPTPTVDLTSSTVDLGRMRPSP